MSDSSVDPELLAKLACPQTHKPLALATAEQVERWNQAIAKGELQTVDGRKIEEMIDGALVVEGETTAYPIRDAIPILLIEEGFKF